MIIDCHGHYTTSPKELDVWREAQLAGAVAPGSEPAISDDQLRETIENGQLRQQRERGSDITLLSPRAKGMGHHLGDRSVGEAWATVCNNLIHRITRLFPDNFFGVCQLPQSPGVEPVNCIAELERCVTELGFVGCLLNPDPSGGYWQAPPLIDRSWYPLYEKMVELDVPAMIHVSNSCNPAFHATGAHYINGDTTAVMQLIEGDLFTDFPTLKIIVPHGGGAAPYHWGRYRGLAAMLKKPKLVEHLLNNTFFDTCVYHQPGIDLLATVIPVDNILFASEMIGAVQGIDPETGFAFDDTRRYVDALAISDADKHKIFELNARRVFPRLDAQLRARG